MARRRSVADARARDALDQHLVLVRRHSLSHQLEAIIVAAEWHELELIGSIAVDFFDVREVPLSGVVDIGNGLVRDLSRRHYQTSAVAADEVIVLHLKGHQGLLRVRPSAWFGRAVGLAGRALSLMKPLNELLGAFGIGETKDKTVGLAAAILDGTCEIKRQIPGLRTRIADVASRDDKRSGRLLAVNEHQVLSRDDELAVYRTKGHSELHLLGLLIRRGLRGGGVLLGNSTIRGNQKYRECTGSKSNETFSKHMDTSFL